MHPDLSPHLHTEECNIIISQLQKCHEENPWKKFMGVCNDLDRALIKCLRKEREENRRRNIDAYTKRNKIKEELSNKAKQG